MRHLTDCSSFAQSTWTRRACGVVAAVAVVVLALSAVLAAPSSAAAPHKYVIAPSVPGGVNYRCVGAPIVLFTNINASTPSAAGAAPTFNTNGSRYCLTSVETVHWNGGLGVTPGMIGLKVINGFGGSRNTLGMWGAKDGSASGAPVNTTWITTLAQPVVILGSYSCVDSDTATWSQNVTSKGKGFCKVMVKRVAKVGAPKPATPTYTCVGNQLTLFDNTNGVGVQQGGKKPFFTTWVNMGIQEYCLNSISTYHWNEGQGMTPGTIGLLPMIFGSLYFPVPPRHAIGSAGQGGSPNVNWTVNYPAPPNSKIITGAYLCNDSDPNSWSQNSASKGNGFCKVYATPAFISKITLPSGLKLLQQTPPSVSTGTNAPSTGAPKCTNSAVTNFLIDPNNASPDGWFDILLRCNTTTANGFTGRMAPFSVLAIDRGCSPFWTYPTASGNPPPPMFLRYTGPSTSPCHVHALPNLRFTVKGSTRLEVQAHDVIGQAALVPGNYTLWVRWAGGDSGAGNTLNVA